MASVNCEHDDTMVWQRVPHYCLLWEEASWVEPLFSCYKQLKFRISACDFVAGILNIDRVICNCDQETYIGLHQWYRSVFLTMMSNEQHGVSNRTHRASYIISSIFSLNSIRIAFPFWAHTTSTPCVPLTKASNAVMKSSWPGPKIVSG